MRHEGPKIPSEGGQWWEIGEVAAALIVDEARLRKLIAQLEIPIRTVRIQVHRTKPAMGEVIHIKAVRQLAALSRQQLLGW